MNFRGFIIRLLKPISVWAGKAHYAPHERLIRAGMIEDMLTVMKSGDVIVTYSRGELTNYFIEGPYKHAAIYIGAGVIIQAIGKGVSIENFEDFCASKDRIAILRPTFCDEGTRELAAWNVMSQVGKPYDYYFEIGDGAFYCAELIEWAYRNATKGASPFTKRDTVLPSDFYQAKSKFTLVIECPLP
jgi:uncharacterized protein YycO